MVQLEQPLPYADFKWFEHKEIKSSDVINMDIDSDTGYVHEMILHYPGRLHDLHSDYPLAPVRQHVTFDMLSKFSKRLEKSIFNFSLLPTLTQKLLTALYDKQNYILHFRNLKLYLRHG